MASASGRYAKRMVDRITARKLMKKTLLTLWVHLGLAFLGLLAGTAASAPVNGLALQSGDFAGAVVLSPFEMTLGIPIVFRWYSPLTGTLMIVGAVVCTASLVYAVKRPGVWTQAGVLLGAALWSLGNVAAFQAFVSV